MPANGECACISPRWSYYWPMATFFYPTSSNSLAALKLIDSESCVQQSFDHGVMVTVSTASLVVS